MGVVKMSELPEPQKRYDEPKKNTVVRMGDIPDPGRERQKKLFFEINRKVGDVLKQGAWNGQRCFIIGGGPSVRKHDLKALEGEHTIAVNLAFRLFEPEIIYGMDARLWGWIENDVTGAGDCAKFDLSKALKVWGDGDVAPLPEDIVVAPSIGRQGLSTNLKEGLGLGSNSGFGALNLALLLGAKEIYLIGFDMKGDRWHNGYPEGKDVTHEYHMDCYIENAGEIKTLFPGQKVINVNSESGLRCFEFGEMPKDLKKKAADKPPRERGEGEPVFVSYYTKGNGYDKHAKNLKRTLEEFGLDHDIQAVKDRGSWDKNTKIKPDFLLKMLDRHEGRPLVWLDADAIVSANPELLLSGNLKDTDVAFHRRNKEELLSGTIYLSGSDKCRDFLQKWNALCNDKKNLKVWDQKLADEALHLFEGTLGELPPEYAYINGLQNPDCGEPVIEHMAASRTLKK